MRLASHLRKLAYPAVLVLLSLVFTGGASAQAQAPAAQYIGVDAYSTPTWAQVGDPSSEYYAGASAKREILLQERAAGQRCGYHV
jgi:hypothetical protein